MKLDTPDPVSFQDAVQFSDFMSGPPADFSLEPRPLAEPATGSLPTGQFSSLGTANTAIGTTAQHHPPGHPPDEHHFMEQIDQVLGPMDDEDPLAELLNLS